MRADAESSTVRLLVAGTKKQPVPMFIGGNLTIVESDTVVGEQHGGVGHLGLRHFAALLLPLGHLWLMIVCAQFLPSLSSRSQLSFSHRFHHRVSKDISRTSVPRFACQSPLPSSSTSSAQDQGRNRFGTGRETL